MSAGELARNRNNRRHYRAQSARVDHHRAAERMANQCSSIMPHTLEESQCGERVEHTFVEFVWLPVVHPRNRNTAMRHDQPEPRIKHRRAIESPDRAADTENCSR